MPPAALASFGLAAWRWHDHDVLRGADDAHSQMVPRLRADNLGVLVRHA